MCTGQTWYTVGPTIRYQLEGTLPAGVGGKDVFLHLAGTYGDAANHNLEFGGPGLASVPMNDRRTIATQGAEVSADFSIFEFDEQCGEFLAAQGAQYYWPAERDPDAGYAEVRTTDLSVLEPYVARPGKVSGNALPISQIEHRAVNQCFIGSCANGQLADLKIAAQIRRGRGVADGVRLIVTPASQQVYRDAVRLGYVQDLAGAGAVVTNSTCGACFGYHMGVLGDGEVRLTASTRNFRGRMGSASAEIYMASTLPIPEAARHVFCDLRPGWTEQVRPGDIVVAGRNFGIGSSRPVAALMRELGAAALVAEEFNSLFLRNAINNGLPALTVPDARELVSEGDVITVHLAEGWLAAGERRIEAAPLPAMVLDILDAGGLLPRLVADGYLAAGRTGAKG